MTDSKDRETANLPELAETGRNELIYSWEEDERGVDPTTLYERYDPLQKVERHDLYETFLMRRRTDRKPCIIKVYDPEAEFDAARAETYLRGLNHPRLAEFMETLQLGTASCVCRAYTPGESLNYLGRNRRFNEEHVYQIITQVCEVVGYLHEQDPPVYHRAIKSTNVVVDEDVAYVTDIDSYREQLADTGEFPGPLKDIHDIGRLIRRMLPGKARPIEEVPVTLRDFGEKCQAAGTPQGYATMHEVRQVLAGLKPGVERRKKQRFLLLGGILLAWVALVGVLLNHFLPQFL